MLKKLYEAMLSKDFYKRIEDILKTEFNDCTIKADNLGNITLQRGEGGVKLICPLKPIKLMITKVEDEKIKFITDDYISPKALINKEAVLEDGTEGLILPLKDTEGDLNTKDLYIDIGECMSDDVKLYSFTEIIDDFKKFSGMICGSFVSNIIPAYVCINALKAFCNDEKPFSLTFFVSKNLSENIISDTEPYILSFSAMNEAEDFNCGNGCGIIFKSKDTIIDEAIKNVVLSGENDCQIIVSNENCTPFGETSIKFRGGRCGNFCVPVRDIQSGMEKIYLKDVEKSEKLLLKTISLL